MLVASVINAIEEWIYVLYVKNIIFAVFISSVFIYAEPLLYGFGSDYDSNEIQDNTPPHSRSLDDLYQKVEAQEERIDGLATLIEGLSISVQGLKSPLNSTDKASSEDLAQIVDEINQNYITKQELETLLGKKISSSKTIPIKSANNPPNEDSKNLSKGEHYTTAVKFFLKKRYAQAKVHFTYTQNKNYKPAGSSYYLGEIAYFSHQYKNAIYHFKKSVSLYAEAPYLDTLLLHTAISFEKTSQIDQARAFYENIIDNYPEKKTAKIAKKRLEKL